MNAPFIDATEQAVIGDALLALEAQLHGATMMPPRGPDALWTRCERAARLAGCSAPQLVSFWLEGAGLRPLQGMAAAAGSARG